MYSTKSITRPLSCVGLQNHYCWKSFPVYTDQPNWNVDVPTDIGTNHHYKKCHFDEFLQKKGICHSITTGPDITTDDSMLKFRDKLAQAVASKLLELGSEVVLDVLS